MSYDTMASSCRKAFARGFSWFVWSSYVRSGYVFERATIELWLKTRGSVCPLSGQPLHLDALRDDTALRSKIMRWHIHNLAKQTSHAAYEGDDLYSF